MNCTDQDARNIRKRVYRYLDAALCRKAFDTEGSLFMQSAEAIADHMAAEWDNWKKDLAFHRRSDFGPTPDRDEVEPHVVRWLDQNINIGRE